MDSQHHAEPKPRLPPADQITRQRRAKRNANDEHKEATSRLERLALWITDNVGTMGFFTIIVTWTVLWMGWNYLAHTYNWGGVFDKPYEYGVWLFFSNLIQLMLLPLIMLGQNLQSRHAELRAEQEFHLTQQTEREMEVVLHYLEQIKTEVGELHQHLAAVDKSP